MTLDRILYIRTFIYIVKINNKINRHNIINMYCTDKVDLPEEISGNVDLFSADYNNFVPL